jgi:hypothetical protein
LFIFSLLHQRLRHHGDNNQSTLCESFEGFDRVLDSLQALCPTDCESFTWTDEVNTAYSQVFHVDVGAAMHSDQRAVSVPQTIAPVLRVAEFGRVSPEVVIANQVFTHHFDFMFEFNLIFSFVCSESIAVLHREVLGAQLHSVDRIFGSLLAVQSRLVLLERVPEGDLARAS